MPIFDYHCPDCGNEWENIEVCSSHTPEECPKCSSKQFYKIFNMIPNIRMNADVMKHELPDPSPPLEELRDKGTPGYKDKPEASRKLSDYTRRKDKQGNTIWEEKKKMVFDMGGNKL